MSTDRKYTEDEVSTILERATEAQTSRASSSSQGTGLTLRELREIGREVGISEEEITRAARSLDRPTPAPTPDRRFLGQTIGVGRTVDLPRPLTDEEWHRLVVDLRETFDAKGKLRDEGPFRQWSNSNLQVFLEPSGGGQRLRLRTLKGNARSFQGMGLGFMGLSLVEGVTGILGMANDPTDLLVFGVMGLAFFAGSRLTIPTWATTRAQQFEAIIDRVIQSVDATLPPGETPGQLPGASGSPGS